MDENLPASAGPHREDSFDSAVRGYNRQQVHEYMARSSQLLATLEQHLSVARSDAQKARQDAEQAQAATEALRAAQAEAKPVHAEVSDRLSQILRLASEEADGERAKADTEIAKLRDETQAECERLVNEARAEADHDLAEARDTAAKELADARSTADSELTAARQTAESELAEARADAEHEVSTARATADQLRTESVRHAEHLLDDAQRRSGAVNDVSGQRLETLTATHGEALLRLGQIRDVLADLLDRDAAAGSLAAVVESVMVASGTPDPGLPAGLRQAIGQGEPDAEGTDETAAVPTAQAEEPVTPIDEAETAEAPVGATLADDPDELAPTTDFDPSSVELDADAVTLEDEELATVSAGSVRSDEDDSLEVPARAGAASGVGGSARR